MTAYLQTAVRWAVLAGLSGVLGVIVGVLGSSLHWSFDLLAQFLLPASVVALLIVPVAALARWPEIAGGAAVAVVVAYALAMPSVTPAGPVAAEAPRFRVLLFNMWFGNKRLSDVAQLIQRENADLVVILESSLRARNALRKVTSVYPYRFDCTASGCDVVAFSRARLLPQTIARTSDANRSPYVTIGTDIAGCRLTILATHLTRPFPHRPYESQREQAREIGGVVGGIAGAKVVLGDFNGAPWAYVVRTIEVRGDVRAATGAGGTWPSVLPEQLRIPIDHVMVGPGLTVASRTILPATGSDHRPVLAEIAVTDPSQCR
jgi:endonuclease/exonuclease/phosphatase (EEP) superfamily protein YafD